MPSIPAPDPSPLPPDDRSRAVSSWRPGDADRVVRLVGNTYTILVSGEESAGAFTLIDMVVPPGGGPPPHRHDFEETFTVLEGEIEVTVRGETTTARAGDTLNIPANAPHRFTNAADAPAHLHCICAPAGQDEFFRRVDAGENPAELAAIYRSEMLDEA